MFIIVVYDIFEKQTAKVLKKCRQYLYWVQNSVFKGEVTKTKFKMLPEKLGRVIDKKEDSMIILLEEYSFIKSNRATERRVAFNFVVDHR